MALLEDLPCPVVNRIGGGMSNNSKPYQALLLRRAGLKRAADPRHQRSRPRPAPSRPSTARWSTSRLSGTRSIVRRLGPDQLARLAFLRHGPAQFQAFVPGRNVRVHTVGDRVFATRIETEAVDYRYAHLDGLDVAMKPATLPAAVEAACLRAARRSRSPLRRDRPQGDAGRRVRLLRSEPLPGLHLLRAPHRPADQHGARRPAQRHDARRPARGPPCHEIDLRPFNQERTTMAKSSDKTSNQPFVSQADRPEIAAEIRHPAQRAPGARPRHPPWAGRRHRQGFLGRQGLAEGRFRRPQQAWKEGKEFKDKEKEKDKEKDKEKEKREKPEKPEIKEVKLEKLESDGVFEPGILPGPDPRLDQVIQALSGLPMRVVPARRPGRGAEESRQGLILVIEASIRAGCGAPLADFAIWRPTVPRAPSRRPAIPRCRARPAVGCSFMPRLRNIACACCWRAWGYTG